MDPYVQGCQVPFSKIFRKMLDCLDGVKNTMTWKGKAKATYIELPEDMHRAMKSAAASRGIAVSRAYIEAATAWLSGGPANIPPERAALVRDFLALYDMPDSGKNLHRDMLVRALHAVLPEHTSEGDVVKSEDNTRIGE